MGWAVVSLVNKKVATVGGTGSAISLISDSGIGPGPRDMRDTRPIAEAPAATASAASAGEAMQQTFTRGGPGSMAGPASCATLLTCMPFSVGECGLVPWCG